MTDRIFVTCASYVLGRILGQQQAADEMSAQLNAIAGPNSLMYQPGYVRSAGILPAMRTIVELSCVAELTIRCDGGCSDIAKYRSRMMHEFLQSECTTWMSIDDDVEASPETLRDLILATRSLKPTIAVAPCVLRDGKTVNVRWPAVYVEETLSSGTVMRRCDAAGFGLVMMNRAAATSLDGVSTYFLDDDGVRKLAPFYPLQEDERWMGEDVSFFALAKKADVERWALLSGATRHAGYTLEFAKLV